MTENGWLFAKHIFGFSWETASSHFLTVRYSHVTKSWPMECAQKWCLLVNPFTGPCVLSLPLSCCWMWMSRWPWYHVVSIPLLLWFSSSSPHLLASHYMSEKLFYNGSRCRDSPSAALAAGITLSRTFGNVSGGPLANILLYPCISQGLPEKQTYMKDP